MTDDAETRMRHAAARALQLPDADVDLVGEPGLSSAYPVSALATGSIATAAVAVADLLAATGLPRPRVAVDRGRADVWFGTAVRPLGWAPPPPWDPIAGDYRARDGWIRVHTNAPHHREAALRVLGAPAEREAVAAAVQARAADALESAIVAEGGCAARLRAPAEWAGHPQGTAVAAEPLVAVEPTWAGPVGENWRPSTARPLAGLRVLDLTRVLAGPVATRMLAGLGADVLRIDPPTWDEPALEPDMTLGKRCARLDGRDPAGLERLRELVAGADVLVHGYRAGALAALGLSDAERDALRPGLVDVSLTAYGHTGPWAGRRGFDSIVQMSSGIAAAGPLDGTSERPTPLPVQALDHATGYLMAAAALAGVARRIRDGVGSRSRLSLARTAVELERARSTARFVPNGTSGASKVRFGTNRRITTPWGAADVAGAPLAIDGVDVRWERGPRALGSDAAEW